MKRTAFALIFLALCISLCILSNFYVEKATAEILEYLENAEKSIINKDISSASENVSLAEKKWEKAEPFYSSMWDNLLVENLDMNINTLDKYIATGQKEQAIVVIEECRTCLKVINSWHKLLWRNIF